MFVHFFHDQLLSLVATDASTRLQALSGALRWATFLSPDPLYMPTVDLVQSPVAGAMQADLQSLAGARLLWFVGSSTSVDRIHTSKQAHFRRTSLDTLWQDRDRFKRLEIFQHALTARELNTTLDLKHRWMQDVSRLMNQTVGEDSPSIAQFRQATAALPSSTSHRKLFARFAMIPTRLEDHAFLWRVVEDLRILGVRTSPEARRHFEIGLAWHWIVSHLEELGTTLLGRIPGLGDMSFGVRLTHPAKVYDLHAYVEATKTLRLDRALVSLSIDELLSIRTDPGSMALRDTLIRPLASRYGEAGTGAAPEQLLLPRCQSVRDAVAGATTPLGAVQLASRMAMSFLDREDARSFTRPLTVTVGVAVALAEELKAIHEAVVAAVGDLTVEESHRTGHVAYHATYGTKSGATVELIFSLVGKGQERAAATTAMLLMEHDLDLVVNAGIAGSMSDDVSVGDVIVGTEVSSYLANSKAVPNGGDGFEFRLAGDTVRSDQLLVDRVTQLDLLGAGEMATYRARLRDYAQRQPGVGALGELALRVEAAPIACGPTVGAAQEFKRWLLTHKRDFAALDMESSGVGIATDLGAFFRRRRFVVLRGISDLADERKSRLEQESKGAARKIATVAPLFLLLALLEVIPAGAFDERSAGPRAV